ncbi:unnamed protein product, partial [Gulo gulo]
MAFGVSISVYLLFRAMTALTAEAAVSGTPPITTQQSNWTVNKTEGIFFTLVYFKCLFFFF